MTPQRFEKIESAPGKGMASEASNAQYVVRGRAADRARLRLTSRGKHKVAELQKKAPTALKSLDAELKSAPAFRHPDATANIRFAEAPKALAAAPPLLRRRLQRRQVAAAIERAGGPVQV
jgi:hypothetical protein